ncbi:MAG: GspH/FimT family pseudopilin, partial [Gammaproteobacteria bacterium]
KGFTLLELLVVIVIVAILAALMVPSLAGNSGRDAADSARRMVLLINQAQQEAVLSSRVWRIVFDPEADSYHFGRRAGSDFESVSLTPFAGEHVLPTVSLEHLEINGESVSEAAEIYLFPTGEQDAFRLTLSGGDQVYGIVMGPVGPARLEQL